MVILLVALFMAILIACGSRHGDIACDAGSIQEVKQGAYLSLYV